MTPATTATHRRRSPHDRPGNVQPVRPDTLQCPFPHYAEMREERRCMLGRALGFYLVTRHDLVLEVLRDADTYSSQFGGTCMPLPPTTCASG